MDKISVVIPVYNTEKYLCQCLESILCQTWTNLEVICVNDGSSDGSAAILRKYAEKDNRIRVFTQENRGIGCARDVGLQAATGEWITFVDSDDWLDPEMYSKLMAFGQANPAEILVCGYWFSNPETESEAVNLHPVPTGVQDIQSFLYYIYCRDEYRGVASYLWNKLFSASCIGSGESRLRFDAAYTGHGEDLDWAARLFMRTRTIAYLSEPLYHYRLRRDSTSGNLDSSLDTFQHIRAYEEMIALFEANQVDERTLDYVKRFYVYHIGRLLEYSIKQGNKGKTEILRKKAEPYLSTYIKTNQNHPERIRWMMDLLKDTDEQEQTVRKEQL